MTIRPPPRLARWLPVVGVLGVIGVLTLRPLPPLAIPIPTFCLVCGDLGGVDVILNVLLFIPLGIALTRAGGSWRKSVLLASLTSVAIESLQVSIVTGRDASLSDLLTNSAGGVIGTLLATRWRAMLAPDPRTARLAGAAAAGLVVLVMAATAALLQPAIPHMGLWGQWTPQQLHFEPYSGTVTDFRVNDIFVPYNLVPESEPLRRRLLAGEPEARLTFVTGRPPQRLSAIGRLGSRIQEVLLLGALGDALIFRTRLAARDWRLRVPGIALPGALPTEGTPVVADAGVRAGRWYARVRVAGSGNDREARTVAREVPFAVSLGWTMLLPFDHPLGPSDHWLSALWLAGLALPAAAWGAMGGRVHSRREGFNRWWALAVTVMALGLATIPTLAHFPRAAASEWVGLVGGSVAGAVLASWLRRVAKLPVARRAGNARDPEESPEGHGARA